jgi:putative transposase
MRKSRFTEAQIIGMIKEQEAGMPTAEVCRRHGLSTATFYKLKSKYGGMEVSEAARLKALEDENAKLKRLLADAMLDNVVLKDRDRPVSPLWRSSRVTCNAAWAA